MSIRFFAGALLAVLAWLAAHDATAAVALKSMLEPWHGDLDGMVERRYIRILTVANKTNYFFDKSRQRGATVEAAQAFEEVVNQKLGSKTVRVTVALLPVTRDQLFPALIDGRGDIAAANLTITPERTKLVDFGSPFIKGVKEVLVTPKSTPLVASPDALSGMKIFARPSSSYYASLQAQNEKLKGAGKRPIEIVDADERLENEDLLEMVNAEIVPAVIVDDAIAEFWASVLPNLQVHPDAAVRTGGEIAWAVRKTSPKLKAMVDEFSRTHGKGTLFGNVVLKRYFKDNQWVRNPTGQAEIARFNSTVQFFRTYGDKYNLPSLLVAAQAYQESGIDQSKRNPSGAVGVMQIKPSTAAGRPILIKGVDESAERNIEAGAKYLRFIVDQYYANEPMERLDKGLFAIASYNAGPARIERLRKKTAEMGLDPNQWFGNVEVAVANEIGRETVQYVSNIYKYYVTYTLLAQERQGRNEARAGVAQ
jgi:membrane-bound lytic murein transglycosylase MltF